MTLKHPAAWGLLIITALGLPQRTAPQDVGLETPPAAPGQANLTWQIPTSTIAEPGLPLRENLIVTNHSPRPAEVSVRWTLQTNPEYDDSTPPDAVKGLDHALGATCAWTLDGQPRGDALMADGADWTGAETPWGGEYREAVVLVELATVRNLTAMSLQNGDANWIWKLDVSVSVDGARFEPVPGLQGHDLHALWGRQDLPWPTQPVPARFVRLRFHDNGAAHPSLRLPVSVSLYDGIANDVAAIPHTGAVVASGTAQALVPPQDSAPIVLEGPEPIGPGSYLVGITATHDGQTRVLWYPLFVRPSAAVDPVGAGRFGINASDVTLAEEMGRCGFGWVRFENAKWRMYCTAPDHYAFDGSVPPWHVNHDAIFAAYQRLGMKVLPYVFQPPEWATAAPADVTANRGGYPPRDPADYGQAIFQLVARHGSAPVEKALLLTQDRLSGLGQIDAVELWNEPNLNDPGWGPFVGPITRYFDVLRAGAEGARRADPDLPVSSCGWAGIDLEDVGQLATHHYPDGKTPLDLVDIVNVHFYSGREEPERCGLDPNVDRNGTVAAGQSYPDQLVDLVAWRDKLKPEAQLWLTETGNDVGGPIGKSERDQAAKVPRAVMIALALGIDKVFVYRESGSDPTMHAGAGLVRNDRSPRPVWFTMATLIRQLQGFEGRALRLPCDDPAVWMWLWDDGSRRLITAWRLDGTRPLGVELGAAVVTDAFGQRTEAAGTADLALSAFPLYIEPVSPGTQLQDLITAAQAAERARLQTREAREAVLALHFDFGPPDQKLGMLKGYGLPRSFTPVDRDQVWDEAAGFGFLTVAQSHDDRGWIRDPLERDSCKLTPENRFRLRLPAGRFRIQVSAQSVRDVPGDVVVETSAGMDRRTNIQPNRPVEFEVAGGQIIQIAIPPYGSLHWVAALREEESPANP